MPDGAPQKKKKLIVTASVTAAAVAIAALIIFIIVPGIRSSRLVRLGDSALASGKIDKAAEYYEQARDIFPLSGKAKTGLEAADAKREKQELEQKLTEYYYNYMVKWSSLCSDARNGYTYAAGFDPSMSPAEQIKQTDPETGKTVLWSDYIAETTVEYLNELDALYKYAVSLGYEISDKDKAGIDASVQAIKDGAEQSGVSFEQYVLASYGKSISEKKFREQMEKEKTVDAFSDEWTYSARKNYTKEQIREVYMKDPGAYDSVDLRVFCFDESTYGEKAKNYAQKVANSAKSTDDFIDYIMEFSDKDAFASREDADYATTSYGIKRSSIEKGLSKDAAYWALDKSRKQGETKIFESKKGESDGYYVLYVVKPAYQKQVVDIRHIYFSTVDPSYQPLSDKDIKAAEEKAKEVKTLWENSEKSEEYFASLAKEYSDDSDTASEGGLVESVVEGQMFDVFDEWIFDSARKRGDCGLVESEYGYHLIYFIEKKDEYNAAVLVDKVSGEYDKLVESLIGGKPYLDPDSKDVKDASAQAIKFIENQYLNGEK